MQRPFSAYFILPVLAVFLFASCANNNSFEINEFNPLTNYNQKKNDSTYLIKADLSNAVLYGIEIPSIKQLPNGKFAFSFNLKNKTGKEQYFYYKLYYQNESYKWPEGDSLDYENFYGSWTEADLEFKRALVADESLITDSFKIAGNPRDEKLFYGTDPETGILSDTLLNRYIQKVIKDSTWYRSVFDKAKINKVSHNDQLYFEALWAINYQFQTDSVYNNRWKRNPRMGNYKFMLVVCNTQGLAQIPDEVKRISLKDSSRKFVNPFTYFLKGNGGQIEGVKVVLSGSQLSVRTEMDPGSGIYTDPLHLSYSWKKDHFNTSCGSSDHLYREAQFSQYFHHINRNYEFANVKETRDVVDEDMSREEYQKLISEYTKSKNFIHTYAAATDCPCKTVSSDSISRSISIFNPGNENGSYKKEHVGIISRVGLSYGKWRAKIKFPKILSKDNVWNGITSAFWLIFQSDQNWNIRRACNGPVGYIPRHLDDNAASLKQSQPYVTYSEIDFEILKESKYWTKAAYNDRPDYPREDASLNNDVTICCTNWDMGCQQPENYIVGAKQANVEGYSHEFCRWNDYNKLLTAKKSAPHSEVFNDDFYYFEIDWQPQRIIWRVGKDKNNLKEICRMDGTMTSIPNNQMVMVMSQEFHYQDWWPTAPFMANFIPFPKNNIVGKLLEVEIE